MLGAIIAGGSASRFGSDKALALLGGKPLIEHAIAAIAPFCATLVMCGREWDDLPSLADNPGPGLGPLGGLHAALRHAASLGFEDVLTIGCDMPVVPRSLIAAITGQRPSYCADAPILGCWPVSAAMALAARLGEAEAAHGKSPGLSIRRWAASVGATPVAAPVPLVNINTPADLTAL